LLIGYDKQRWVKWPIIIDMEITPHLFVSGLSGNGKSRMVEYAIKDKNVVLINVFRKDFRSIKTRRINGNENILKYLTNLLKNMYYRKKPLYIVIDELIVLCLDSKITKAIMEILAIGRHYNIYIIGISQLGTKETVKFKDLFNARVSFRQVEESSYRAVLGYSPPVRTLQKRQFLYYSHEIGMGYTYDVS
jgi:Cdc6-like AAA superfamily ATPase